MDNGCMLDAETWGSARGMDASCCGCTCPKRALLISETDIGFSSLGLLSTGKMGGLLVKTPEPRPPLQEAASSAAKEDRTEVSICAEDVEAASFAATAAAAFLCCSSVIKEFAKEVTGCKGWGGGVLKEFAKEVIGRDGWGGGVLKEFVKEATGSNGWSDGVPNVFAKEVTGSWGGGELKEFLKGDGGCNSWGGGE